MNKPTLFGHYAQSDKSTRLTQRLGGAPVHCRRGDDQNRDLVHLASVQQVNRRPVAAGEGEDVEEPLLVVECLKAAQQKVEGQGQRRWI